MELIGTIQYFFNNTLPESIIDTFNIIFNIMSNTIGWILLFLLFISFFFIYFFYKKEYKLKQNKFELDNILFATAQCKTIEELNNIFVKFVSWLDGKYYALYQLHSETYVLLGSNIKINDKNSPAAASLHLKPNQFKLFYESGNFNVSSYQIDSKKYIIRFYAKDRLDIMRYHGVIETLLSKYASLSNDDEQLTSLQLAKTSKELLKIINGNHFGNDGYIKYVLSMIKEVIDANQIILQGKDKVYFKLGEITNDKGVEKIFYIRNTNFKVCINTKEAMDLDRLMKIGSFLDLTGMFLSTLDEESTIAKNYIDFLYDANKLLEERENNYLHSEKVNIVVVELAKKLFLSTQEMEALSQAAMLHDIGSMQDLDDMDNEYFDETNEHKLHPLIGAILMEPVGNIYPITNIIKYHHERLDGKGYPFGLVGNKIPILSQILGLAEYYVGLISERSIEMGMNYEGAISLMEKSANRMFDNVLVETFLIIHEDVKKKITQLEIKAKLQEGS
jgi:HD-GYP domain-containing protein (c-di-GMP phosphodiesterase class II)